MIFHSIDYVFIFLPITVAGYLLLRNTPFESLFLLVASLYFYAVGNWWWLIPFFISATIDYFIGHSIHRSSDEEFRSRLIVVSVIFNLGLLSLFKYTSWLSSNVTYLGSQVGLIIPVLTVALPAGISFYTFQSMSYTIDIKRRSFAPGPGGIVDYLAFVAFFPQLIAGPIMRAADLLPQFNRSRPLPSAENVSLGCLMILFGLFMKIVLADHFGGIVDAISQSMRGQTTLAPGLGLLFAYGFAGQIYCDFLAYSTIAWGSAKLFNIELMDNFKTPYFAVNPSDFWRRWHISLSTWLRDYLYISLGGNRYGVPRTLINLLITMLLGGLWHGASFMFIFWGAWHGFLLIVYRVFPIDEMLIRHFGRAGHILSIILTFHLICFGWILFRATPTEFWLVMESIGAMPGKFLSQFEALVPHWANFRGSPLHLLSLLKGTLGHYILQNWVFAIYGWGLFIYSFVLFITDYVGYRTKGNFYNVFPRMPLLLKTFTILILFYAIIWFGRREANDFIYFAF